MPEPSKPPRPGVRWRDQTSLDWYDRKTVWFWMVASVVFMAILLLQLLGPKAWEDYLFWIDWAISVTFLADYLLRLYMAPRKWWFVLRWWNILDLFVVAVPFVSLFTGAEWAGFFRIARILRLLMLGTKTGVRFVFTRAQVKWFGLAALVVVVASWFIVWRVEAEHADSHIHTAFDAFWWAMVTLFTVGYGETYPHTLVGKIAAMVLMIVGIAFFGWATAALASLFVEGSSEVEAKQERAELMDKVRNIDDRLARLEQLLTARETGAGEDPDQSPAPPSDP